MFSQGESLLFYGVGFLITCTFDNDAFHAAATNTRAINTGATDEELRCSLARHTRPSAVDVTLIFHYDSSKLG